MAMFRSRISTIRNNNAAPPGRRIVGFNTPIPVSAMPSALSPVHMAALNMRPVPPVPTSTQMPQMPTDGGGEGGGGGDTSSQQSQDQQPQDQQPQDQQPQDQQQDWQTSNPDDGGAPTEADYLNMEPPASPPDGGDAPPSDGTAPSPDGTDVIPDQFYGDPFPLVSAHVRNGHLRTVALMRTPSGDIAPLTTCLPIPAMVPDGYVLFGCETGIFGLDVAINQSKAALMDKAEKERVRLECESLVRRARRGDQNAIALLSGLSDNAKKGNSRARYALNCVRSYIKKHPADASMGNDVRDTHDNITNFWTVASLANGAPLTMPRVYGVASSFGSEQAQNMFMSGVAMFRQGKKLDALMERLGEEDARALALGRSVGEARALQKVRRGAPLKVLDPMIGWEMGE